uniref:Uncharacterized protein n=1 Tax=Tanacetum cinerariifolium TaxID=118510 RepID=A0A6L2MPY9_TANCI|nr:hypothetical protein [Tanacetum cinerariifolium]
MESLNFNFQERELHQLQQMESILEREKHKREKDRSNETESERHVLSSRSGNHTYTDDADINSVNDKQSMAEVDRNTTPESTDMSHRGGEIDQNADVKKCQVSCPLPDPSEKAFANVALKNELRKSKGNSVDNKFAKPSILGKPVLQPPRNQFVVRQPNAFKSERPNFSKPRFASQVDVNNVLSKPVTPYYLPKVKESAPAKLYHMNAPSFSRNSQKESYGSNDMAHNYYLEEDKKNTRQK